MAGGRRSRAALVACAVAGLLVAACGGADPGDGATAGIEDSSSTDGGGGWIDEKTAGAPAGTVEEAAGDGDYRAVGGAVAESGGAESAPAPDAPARDTGGPTAPERVEATAGSVDDNELWDEYLRYRDEFLATGVPVSDIDVSGRQILRVVDANGDPVLGAQIRISGSDGELARLRTHTDGRAVFNAPTEVDPDSQSRARFSAVIDKGEVHAEVELEPGAPTQTIELDTDIPAPARFDLLFLIDATGSMGDEIERLKAHMISVTEQISGLPAEPDLRLGLVVYRDRGDEYVTRTFDFTADVAELTAALEEIVADGGGDTPESLGVALRDAVEVPSWRGGDTAKLVFLLSDAPPHLPSDPGYEDEPDYADALLEAAARGVKVFPIASSGLDAQGEYIFRQLAQVTMGRFVFLTYGPDGQAPGTSTPHRVDPADYDVLALDDLVVQLVTDELAPLA